MPKVATFVAVATNKKASLKMPYSVCGMMRTNSTGKEILRSAANAFDAVSQKAWTASLGGGFVVVGVAGIRNSLKHTSDCLCSLKHYRTSVARAWLWEKTLRLGNTMRFPLFRCH